MAFFVTAVFRMDTCSPSLPARYASIPRATMRWRSTRPGGAGSSSPAGSRRLLARGFGARLDLRYVVRQLPGEHDVYLTQNRF